MELHVAKIIIILLSVEKQHVRFIFLHFNGMQIYSFFHNVTKQIPHLFCRWQPGRSHK